MLRTALKKTLSAIGVDPGQVYRRLSIWSLIKAAKEQELLTTLEQLRLVVPDISNQESREAPGFNDYSEIKRRLLHAYQVRIMARLLDALSKNHVRVVDIGDSAGTHCLYFKQIFKDTHEVSTLSVNLDPRAIEKIKARGLPALLKRAEELSPKDLGGEVDVFTSFEMVEHLHNPTLFLRKLTNSSTGRQLFITVPFLRKSRVGMNHIRNDVAKDVFAEDVHVFELSPSDWTLLFLHAGWKVVDQGICYQYPRRLSIVSWGLKAYWTMFDFEGFWGAVLERDESWSKLYQDWED